MTEENKESLLKMERWAYRYALNTKRHPVTKHFLPNNLLYNEYGSKELKFDEFVEKCRAKLLAKAKVHKNPLVVNSVKS